MSHTDKIQGRQQTGSPKIKSLEEEMNEDLRVLAQVQVQIRKRNQKDLEEVRIEAIEGVKIADMKRKDQNYLELMMKDMLNALQNIQNQVIRRRINLSKILIT